MNAQDLPDLSRSADTLADMLADAAAIGREQEETVTALWRGVRWALCIEAVAALLVWWAWS